MKSAAQGRVGRSAEPGERRDHPSPAGQVRSVTPSPHSGEHDAATRRRTRRVGSWEATALALQRELDALADENDRLVAENARLAAEAVRLQDGINQLIRAKVEGTL